VATLPVANLSFAAEQSVACSEIDNSIMVVNTNFEMAADMDVECSDVETCHADQCSVQSCDALSFGLPVKNEIFESPEGLLSLSIFAFVKSPEPHESFDRPPIA
jgi:hypothetical protein